MLVNLFKRTCTLFRKSKPSIPDEPKVSASEHCQADNFLSIAYDKSKHDSVRDGIQFVFSSINTLLIHGRFNAINAILYRADIDQLNRDMALALLTITNILSKERKLLTCRDYFMQRLYSKVAAEEGKTYAERLLGGFRW